MLRIFFSSQLSIVQARLASAFACIVDCVVPPAGLRNGQDFFPPPQTPFLFALLPSVKFALALKNEQVLFCSLAANFLWASKEKEGKELQGKTALF